jgi:hypothetical protein
LNELSEAYAINAMKGSTRKPQYLEQQAPFLVHLLAHHGDFNTAELGSFDEGELTVHQIEALKDFEVYVEIPSSVSVCLSPRSLGPSLCTCPLLLW